jgi:MFS family permease
MMCVYLAGMAMFGAIIRDKTPVGKAGMFQGLRIVGQVLIPGVIGPAIGAWVLRDADTIVNGDGTTSFVPNANIFLAAFIAILAVWVVLVPLFKMTKKER